jgi:acetyl esterase/lipase
MLRSVLFLFALCAAAQDLHLAYTSEIDNTAQPYRIYIPDIHPNPAPLVIAMHGAGGNENTLFDQHPTLKQAADNHGMIVVSPKGRGITEYRGIGENDVLAVLEEGVAITANFCNGWCRRQHPLELRSAHLSGCGRKKVSSNFHLLFASE